MANQKVTQLGAITSVLDTDVAMVVSDPGGTPISKKITIANFFTSLVKRTGRSGGQTVQGGTGASEDLTLESTAHATKGHIHAKGALYVDTLATAGIVRNSAAGLLSTSVNDFDVLYDNLMVADAASVNTGNFSQSYTSLMAVISARCGRVSSHFGSLAMQVNGFTGAYYNYQGITINNTTVTAAPGNSGTYAFVGLIGGADADAGHYANTTIWFPGYSFGTTKYPHWHSESGLSADANAATQYLALYSGGADLQGPLRSIQFFTGDGSDLKAGSRFTIYGMK